MSSFQPLSYKCPIYTFRRLSLVALKRFHKGLSQSKLTVDVLLGQNNRLDKLDSPVDSHFVWEESPLTAKVEQEFGGLLADVEWRETSFGQSFFVIIVAEG